MSEMNPVELRIYGHAVLPRQDQQALLVEYSEMADRHGDESKHARGVRDQIVLANQRLVYSIAARYKRFPKGWETADLVAYGNMGLLEAIKRFDPTRGMALSTYAAWWIRHAIQRALADFGNAVRVPVHAQEALALIRKGALDMQDAPRGIGDAAIALQTPHSLDAQVGLDSRSTYADLVADTNATDVMADMEHRQDAERLAVAITHLSSRHQAVVRARMDGPTLTEVGVSADRSRERIRQLEREAYALLRRELGAA